MNKIQLNIYSIKGHLINSSPIIPMKTFEGSYSHYGNDFKCMGMFYKNT